MSLKLYEAIGCSARAECCGPLPQACRLAGSGGRGNHSKLIRRTGWDPHWEGTHKDPGLDRRVS